MEATQLAMLPQAMKLSLDGNKARIDMNMASVSQVILLDSDQKTTTILLDLMGQKIAVKPDKMADLASENEPVVNITSETKEIAGLICKKAEIHFGDEKSMSSPITVYFTEALGNNQVFYDNEYRTLPGIPMEFSYKMQGMSMLMIAGSVEKGKVSKNDFKIPEGYKEMTPDELRQMFGGGQ
ncbi:MAG: hypothetical protein HGA37_15925 [Lentimicrobium sp.]|nr:hypothetical protein [Lentimicrobium sp.]